MQLSHKFVSTSLPSIPGRVVKTLAAREFLLKMVPEMINSSNGLRRVLEETGWADRPAQGFAVMLGYTDLAELSDAVATVAELHGDAQFSQSFFRIVESRLAFSITPKLASLNSRQQEIMEFALIQRAGEQVIFDYAPEDSLVRDFLNTKHEVYARLGNLDSFNEEASFAAHEQINQMYEMAKGEELFKEVTSLGESLDLPDWIAGNFDPIIIYPQMTIACQALEVRDSLAELDRKESALAVKLDYLEQVGHQELVPADLIEAGQMFVEINTLRHTIADQRIMLSGSALEMDAQAQQERMPLSPGSDAIDFLQTRLSNTIQPEKISVQIKAQLKVLNGKEKPDEQEIIDFIKHFKLDFQMIKEDWARAKDNSSSDKGPLQRRMMQLTALFYEFQTRQLREQLEDMKYTNWYKEMLTVQQQIDALLSEMDSIVQRDSQTQLELKILLQPESVETNIISLTMEYNGQVRQHRQRVEQLQSEIAELKKLDDSNAEQVRAEKKRQLEKILDDLAHIEKMAYWMKNSFAHTAEGHLDKMSESALIAARTESVTFLEPLLDEIAQVRSSLN